MTTTWTWNGWGDFGYDDDLIFKPQNLAALGILIALSERSGYYPPMPPMSPGESSTENDGIYSNISLYNPDNPTAVASTGALSGYIKSLCGFFIPNSIAGMLNIGYSLSQIIDMYNNDSQNSWWYPVVYNIAFERIKEYLTIGDFTANRAASLSFKNNGDFRDEIDSMIDIMLSEAMTDCSLHGNNILFRCAKSIASSVSFITIGADVVQWRIGYRWGEKAATTSVQPLMPKEYASMMSIIAAEQESKRRWDIIKSEERGVEIDACNNFEQKQWSLYDVSVPSDNQGGRGTDWPGGNGRGRQGYSKSLTVTSRYTGATYKDINLYAWASEASVGAEGGGFLLPEYYPEKLLGSITGVIGKGTRLLSGESKYCLMQNPTGRLIPSEPGHLCATTGKMTGEWSELPRPETLVISVPAYAKFP